MGVIRPEEKSKLDLQKEEIQRIKREREESYEGKLEDREIEVYNHNSRILLKQQQELAQTWHAQEQPQLEQQIDTNEEAN